MQVALRLLHRSSQNLHIPFLFRSWSSQIVSSLSVPVISPRNTLIMKQAKISSFFTKRPASENPDVDEHTNGSRKKSKPTVERSDEEDVDDSKSKKSASRSRSAASSSRSPKKVSTKKDDPVKKRRAVIYSSEEEDDEPKNNNSDSDRSRSPSPVQPKRELKSASASPEKKRTSSSKSKSPPPKEKSTDSKSRSKSPAPQEKATISKTESKSPSKLKLTDSKSDSKSSSSKKPSKVSKPKSSSGKTSSSKPKTQVKKSSTGTKSASNDKRKQKAASKSDSEDENKGKESVFTDDDEEGEEKKPSKSVSKTNGSSASADDVKSESKVKDESPSPVKTKESSSSKGKSPTSKLPSVKGWDNDYNPAASNYHPIDDASWKRNERVPYMALAKTLEKIEETSSRLKNIEILSNYLRSVILLSPQDLRFSVYLCLNKLAPAYEGIEMGIADTNLMKAIAQATGRALGKIKEDFAARGDLGLVAEASRSSQKTLFTPSPLTVAGVFSKLKDICALSGHASQLKKIGMIQSMLVACKYSEARYLVRSLAGKLRIGLAEQSVLQALATACYLTPPNQNQADPDVEWPPKKKLVNAGKSMNPEKLKAEIEKAAFTMKSYYCECPNYDILTDALLKEGLDGLEKYCQLTPGIPPRPMLAQPTKGIEDILQRFTGINFTCEYKYDGERAQIHLLEDGRVQVYSRNQENNTSKYPEIVGRFKSCIGSGVKSCIVDSEAVAWDREKECILPFQVLSTRKRKDANEAEIKVQVYIFAFDLIYLNGENLVKKPLARRRELLRENFSTVTGEFGFATSLDTDSMEEVQEFLDDSIKGNCEGLMVKTLDVNASYELAKRSQKWLKLKKDYLNSGGDSLDLVVIGGFLGKGKRVGGYGGFLLACYDPENEEFQSICKIGTGFSDEQLEKHAEDLKTNIIPKPKPYYRFHSNLTPDHWFDAVHVWEVKCADLSLSPVHKAAVGIEDPERGISLRFPRFLRIREDKNAEDATSALQVAQLYKNQEVVKSTQGTKTAKDFEDDFY